MSSCLSFCLLIKILSITDQATFLEMILLVDMDYLSFDASKMENYIQVDSS